MLELLTGGGLVAVGVLIGRLGGRKGLQGPPGPPGAMGPMGARGKSWNEEEVR